MPLFWLLLLLVPAVSLLRDFVWRFWQRTYRPRSYHIIQEMQRYQLQDSFPRADEFQKCVRRAPTWLTCRNIRKVRAVQRVRRSRGYAFSQTEGEQAHIIRQYDTTKERPTGL